MITPIANKYAIALIKSSKDDDINDLCQAIKTISQSFSIKKIKYILHSSTNKQKIVQLFMDIANTSNKKIANFLKILASKDRLSLIPQISLALESKQAETTNAYTGYILSKEPIDAQSLKTLQENISKKVSKNITLTHQKSTFDGIKIDIPTLNIQITFSKQQIKTKLIEHILKSI